MKHISLFIISIITAFTVYSQQTNSAVTLTVLGNKNLQLSLDGKVYNLNNATTVGEKTTILVDNFVPGKHSLQVDRTDLNTNRSVRINAEFNLRAGYDMEINVNQDASLELIETRIGSIVDLTPTSTASFNALLRNVRLQKSITGRSNVITTAFNSSKNSFTTNQVRQLLNLVNSESHRLQLAKLSYRLIDDKGDFYQLYNLLSSTASKNELADYVYDYEEISTGTAMSDANFNSLYQTIQQQWPVSAQMTSLTNAFNNTGNYFTTYQAGRLIQLVSAESNRLQLAKLSYRSITDKNNFQQVYDLLNTQASKNELESYVNNYNNSGSTGTAMSDANFNSLYQTIQQQWPVSAQMTSLTNAFNNTGNYFTTYQAGRLIQLVSAENNRLQLAKLSYRSITDKNNFQQVYELLNSQASRNELEAYVNNYNNSGSTGTAMTDANFNSLYQTIQQQWPVSAQMTSLTNAFNNTNYYFTSNQAGRLIQLVTAESNRLQLAKLSYRSITDRNNFYQIYNLLSSQASRNELESYVNNYDAGSTTHNPMPEADFNSLYQTIQQQWPVSAQMTSLTNAFNNTNYYFSSNQAGRLIQLVTAESNRLQLAKLSYRSITDKNNFNQIFNLLSTQASRNELESYVNNYNAGTGTGTKTPMSDSEFTTLYNTINAQYLPFEQMTSLTNVFNNPNYFFTSSQVKQLIPLVSLESNRLQLAKLSYRSITDRANFIIVYDILNSQSSKDQLDAYVKAYKD